MNNVTLTYDSLWAYYQNADEYIQQDILKQLDLENYLPRVPVQVRSEVMKNAPKDIREQIEKIIPLTKDEEEYQTYISRMFSRR